MMRSLWTAASGMIAQQINVDNIANNLANVNTTGYKTATAEFKTLLYQNLQAKTTTANGDTKPISAQVGLGTRNSSITTHFTQGPFLASENPYAYAIDGDGFYGVMAPNGTVYYTRNGDFQMAVNSIGGVTLCSAEGYPVLDTNGNPIEFGPEFEANKIVIDDGGNVYYPVADEDGKEQLEFQDITVALYQFANPVGLDKISGTIFAESAASGVAVEESSDPNLKKSNLRSGYTEGSNVQIVDEMVNLITAQRAYEMNSKAIQAADEMLGQANQLKK